MAQARIHLDEDMRNVIEQSMRMVWDAGFMCCVTTIREAADTLVDQRVKAAVVEFADVLEAKKP